MQIRKAITTDAESLSELVTSLATFYLDSETRMLPDWLLATLKPSEFFRRLSDSNYLNLVSLKDSDIEGYISIKNRTHLYHLFVRERSHGNGIARQLWKRANELAPADEAYTLRSSIFAVPIYKKFGFEEIGPELVKDGLRFQSMVLKPSH